MVTPNSPMISLSQTPLPPTINSDKSHPLSFTCSIGVGHETNNINHLYFDLMNQDWIVQWQRVWAWETFIVIHQHQHWLHPGFTVIEVWSRDRQRSTKTTTIKHQMNSSLMQSDSINESHLSQTEKNTHKRTNCVAKRNGMGKIWGKIFSNTRQKPWQIKCQWDKSNTHKYIGILTYLSKRERWNYTCL